MATAQADEFLDWTMSDLVIEAVRIIRWEACHANENAGVSMDNPFEHEVESVRDAAYWDGYTSAIEAVLRPLLPAGEDWQDGEPCGPRELAHQLLLLAKRRRSTEMEGLRIEIALSLLGT